MKTRYEIAQIIGYSSWADYNAADKMIGKGSNIEKFVADLNAAARPIAEREYAMLLAEKKKTDPAATEISGYQSYHLMEMVRRSQYNFDSQTVRPYLPFNEVKQGVMNTAASLFHISFRQEQNVPSWDPSVETWDVLDNGKVIGRFYLDMFPRPGKYSHQQMVADSRRHSRQAASRGHARLQLPAAHRHRSRPDGIQRRHRLLPRVRPPDASHPRRAAAVGGHQRHHRWRPTSARRRRRCWRSSCAVRRCCSPSPSTTRRARRFRWS